MSAKDKLLQEKIIEKKKLNKLLSDLPTERDLLIQDFVKKTGFVKNSLYYVWRTYLEADFPEYDPLQWDTISWWRQSQREPMIEKFQKEYYGFTGIRFLFGGSRGRDRADGVNFVTLNTQFAYDHKEELARLNDYWPVHVTEKTMKKNIEGVYE